LPLGAAIVAVELAILGMHGDSTAFLGNLNYVLCPKLLGLPRSIIMELESFAGGCLLSSRDVRNTLEGILFKAFFAGLLEEHYLN
jgi:hypothetical protein